MRESKFTILFRHWLRANPRYSAAFELKQTQRDYISFNAVQPHQIAALMAVQNQGLLYKISDETRGFKPFDLFYMRNEEAYVVIKYPLGFVLVDVGVFVEEKKKNKKKSLKWKRAKEIAAEVVETDVKLRFRKAKK